MPTTKYPRGVPLPYTDIVNDYMYGKGYPSQVPCGLDRTAHPVVLSPRNKQQTCPHFSVIFLATHNIERNKTISSLAWFKQKAALHIMWQRLLADAFYHYVKIDTTEL